MTDASELPGEGCLERPFHLGVVVPDLDVAMGVYGEALQLSWSSVRTTATRMRLDAGEVDISFELVWSVDGPVHIELIREVPGTPWMASEGAPYHHAGYLVDDLGAGVRELEQSGFRLEATRAVDGEHATRFAYMRHPLGLRVELMDRQMVGELSAWLRASAPS